MKKYRVASPNGPITIRMYGDRHAAQPKPAYLFFNGWSPSVYPWTPNDLVAGYIAKRRDCICITVYFRGMGSPGNIKTLTRADFLQDATSVYDFVTALAFVDSVNVSAVGESFGSYMASVLSAKRPLKSLILRVPTDFPGEGFDSTPQYMLATNKTLSWKQMPHDYSESPALQALHDFSGKLSIVSSEHDELIPYQTIQNYLNAAGRDAVRHYVMKSTGHSLANPIKLYRFMCLLDGIVQGHSV